MSQTIAVQMSSPTPVLFGAPVPVVITLANHGSAPASVLLSYPNSADLHFKTSASDFAAAKPVEEPMDERSVPIAIGAGQAYSAIYFLNRYFAFRHPGEADIEYELRTMVSISGVSSPSWEIYRGIFHVHLSPGPEQQLQATFASCASHLPDPSRKIRMEAAEALAYVDSPLVVPYLMPMLRIDNLEVIGIHALARHPGHDSQQAILSALHHPDSAVVEAALEEIDRMQVPMPRSEVQHLLSSSNTHTQWVALGWLAAHPKREDLPLIAPLLDSPDPSVRDKARAYADSLGGK